MGIIRSLIHTIIDIVLFIPRMLGRLVRKII
ncbi:hypothetical protein SAMN05421743_101331 [Thalassobacillus cyri]|uniref:Uncharacterized protein n=1 Tax=Thalassobacillus cyri TaxID=571932 RepID=A0A1H3W673_9BACI|nr:hypothetical protein SAMN05421743_101331 [Thalassobacillus cyri]